MARYLIVAIVILLALLAFLAWRLDATQKVETLATAENDRLASALNTLADSHQHELEAIHHAHVTQQKNNRIARQRKQQADQAYRAISAPAKRWANSLVPRDVTASLCITSRRCAMPTTGHTAPPLADRGSGTPTERRVVLNNQSLRNGIEDLRVSLAQCNSKISAIKAWSIKIKAGSQ